MSYVYQYRGRGGGGNLDLQSPNILELPINILQSFGSNQMSYLSKPVIQSVDV